MPTTRSVRSGPGIIIRFGIGSRIVAALIAASLLAACQVPHGDRASQAGRKAPAEPASAAIRSDAIQPAVVQINPEIDPGINPGVNRGVNPGDHSASATIIAAATRNDVAIGPSHLTGDPKELVGLDHAAVLRALGEPLWIRRDQPAQVWQYATADCIVDLYLYDEDGELKVTFVEARSRKAETEPTARCLKSLLERPTASAN